MEERQKREKIEQMLDELEQEKLDRALEILKSLSDRENQLFNRSD